MIDTIFRKRRTEFLESYNFVDITTGQAIITFYGGTDMADAKVISNGTFYSHTVADGVALSPSRPIWDHDYDVTFERFMIVDGTAMVNVPMALESVSANGYSQSMVLEVLILKYDGSTETILGRSGAYTLTRTSPGTSVIDACFKVALARTKFGPGHTLRINISGSTALGTSSETGYAEYAHDPKNRTFITGNSTPSIFQANIPFKRVL